MIDRQTLSTSLTFLRELSLDMDSARRINRELNGRTVRRQYTPAFDVMSEDWDNLIILDGCRYDVFEEDNAIQGYLSSVNSQGAHSFEFMRNTFDGQEFHDTVYVTSNPHIERLDEGIFYAIETTYDEQEQGGHMRLPQDVAELAVETFERYDDKRFIVHFMQPNNPYIGPKAQKLRDELFETKNVVLTEMGSRSEEEIPESYERIPHLRRALKHGYITREEMLEVYRENLEIVQEYATDVMDELGGKTAITADHGDLFGERLPPLFIKEYSHWEETYSEQLRRVPWLVCDSENRRSTHTEQPVGHERMEQHDVKDQLRSMGYLSD